MSIPAGIKRFNGLADRALFWGVATSASLFFGIVIVAVLTRYLLRIPILASIELSRLFFVWSCFLAAALTYRRRAHVAFTLLFEKTPQVVQHWGAILVHVLIFTFSVVILYQSLVILLLFWPTALPMLGASQGWFYVPLPLVAFLLSMFALEFFLEDLQDIRSREA